MGPKFNFLKIFLFKQKMKKDEKLWKKMNGVEKRWTKMNEMTRWKSNDALHFINISDFGICKEDECDTKNDALERK